MPFEINGNYAIFPFVVKQLDFNLINPYLPENNAVVSPILKREVKQYDVAGVHLLVPNITIHQILDTIDFQLKIIHPYKLLSRILADRKEKKVILFGTKFTTNSSYLASFITKNSIANISIEDLLFLDELRKKVYAYAETNQDIINFNKLITKYSKNHIVVIACAELSIINNSGDNNVIDLSRLQFDESLQIILSKS